MTCYKPTAGCGVYENRSCNECPYSTPPVEEINLKTFEINTADILEPQICNTCEICRAEFPVNLYSTARICPECLRRLERMLYPERED